MGIKVTVVNYTSIPARRGMCGSPPATVATVIVDALFDVDSGVVLGRDKRGVSIERKGCVNGQTVLFVSASTYGSSEDERRLAINAVVGRLERFLNNPAQAFEMSQENPFPEPDER